MTEITDWDIDMLTLEQLVSLVGKEEVDLLSSGSAECFGDMGIHIVWIYKRYINLSAEKRSIICDMFNLSDRYYKADRTCTIKAYYLILPPEGHQDMTNEEMEATNYHTNYMVYGPDYYSICL